MKNNGGRFIMKKHIFFSKIITCMLIALMILSLIAGCGKSSSTVSQNKPAAETDKSAEKEQKKETPGIDTPVTINVWTWEPKENQQKIIDDFNKEYPNITVEFNNVNSADMAKKLQTAIAAGSDLPDVAWMEISYRGKLISLDCWEDLTKYGVDKENILDFLIPLSTNERGELVGIEVSPAFAGLAYKRDLAKEYFGTDDPHELQKILPDWDAFIEKGKEVKQKSGGKVFMLTGVDDAFLLLKGQDATPFVIDNKLNLKTVLTPMFNRLVEMTKAGIVDKLQRDTPNWNASFAESKHIFYSCATWSPTYVIKPNDKNSTGRWGLMTPPGGAIAIGGTIVGIPKKAKNKEAAFEYIKWNYLSLNGAKSNRDHLEYFNTMKSTYEDENFYSKPDEFFGGQDVFKTFAKEIAPNMAPSRPVNKYDQEINSAISIAITTINSSKDGNISVDDIIKKVEDDVLAKVPELER